MASRKTLLVAAAMALVALLPTTASKKFTVGDDSGWDVGVDYVAWAHGKKFRAGDKLVFHPKNDGLDVLQVDEQSFNDCTTPDNALLLSTGKPYTGTLTKPGNYFFISDAEGVCDGGLKLAINAH